MQFLFPPRFPHPLEFFLPEERISGDSSLNTTTYRNNNNHRVNHASHSLSIESCFPPSSSSTHHGQRLRRVSLPGDRLIRAVDRAAGREGGPRRVERGGNGTPRTRRHPRDVGKPPSLARPSFFSARPTASPYFYLTPPPSHPSSLPPSPIARKLSLSRTCVCVSRVSLHRCFIKPRPLPLTENDFGELDTGRREGGRYTYSTKRVTNARKILGSWRF